MSAIKFFDDSQEVERAASVVFQLSTAAGARALVEILAGAQVEGQEALGKHRAQHDSLKQKLDLANTLLLHLTKCYTSTDWTGNGEQREAFRESIKMKAVSAKLMGVKKELLAKYLEDMQDLLGGLKSLEKVARKLLALLEEHDGGESEHSSQKVYGVTMKVIDDGWKTLRASRSKAVRNLADYKSVGEVRFEVNVERLPGDGVGSTYKDLVDLQDPAFLQRCLEKCDQEGLFVISSGDDEHV